ncbi:MAG: lipid A core--O-antigen ligase, partial [Proteobacteria bacterium]|nr:lipid A core--O-antigen ligase [Pseudomonadota bacterium]
MPKTGLYIFLSTLIFAPLAFGSVELWSQATNTVLICLAVLAVFWETQKKETNWYTVPALLPLILLLGYMLFQLLPLPPFLLKLLSPQSFTVYSITTPAGDSTWHPLTLSPKATLKEFFRFATYVLCYVAAIQILSRYQSLKKVLLTLCFLAGAIAFEGIIQKYGSPDKIYWFRTTLDNSTMTGPWVYHNHFAGFMEMLLPICLALFLFYRPSFSYNLPLREKIVSVFTLPKANMHIILGLSAILMYVSIFVSLSRGGIISSTLALLLFLFLLTRNRGESSHSTKGKYILVFLLVSVAGISWFGWEPIFGRFDLFASASGEIQ